MFLSFMIVGGINFCLSPESKAINLALIIFPLSKLNEVNQKEIVELNNGFKAHYKRVKQTQKKKNSK